MNEYDDEIAHSGDGINTSQTAALRPIWQFAIDRSAWPAERDLHAFLIWFEWSLHSMIIDLGDDPIEYEEI